MAKTDSLVGVGTNNITLGELEWNYSGLLLGKTKKLPLCIITTMFMCTYACKMKITIKDQLKSEYHAERIKFLKIISETYNLG